MGLPVLLATPSTLQERCDNFDHELGEVEAILCVTRTASLDAFGLNEKIKHLREAYGRLEGHLGKVPELKEVLASTFDVWRRINELCECCERGELSLWDSACVDDHVVKVRLGRLYDEAMRCGRGIFFGVRYVLRIVNERWMVC